MPTLDTAPPRRQSFDDLVAASLHDPVALDKLCRQFRKHLRDWVREHLRSSKTPDVVEFRDELPHTETGKLLRRVLLTELTDP